MGNRMRVVQWQVQPVILADDGDSLEPVQVQPLNIPASAWAAWAAGGWRDSLDQVRAQVEGPPAPPAPDPVPSARTPDQKEITP